MKPANTVLMCSDEPARRYRIDRLYDPMQIQNGVGLMGLGATP